jgi:hypothetical protein
MAQRRRGAKIGEAVKAVKVVEALKEGGGDRVRGRSGEE